VNETGRWERRIGAAAAVAIALLGIALLGAVAATGIKQGAASWDSSLTQLLSFTLFQAALSTLLSLAVGLAVARALVYQPGFFGRRFLVMLLSVVPVLPVMTVILGIVGIYGRNGWLNEVLRSLTGSGGGAFLYGLAGIVLAHVYLNGAYIARTLLEAYGTIPAAHFKLAASLGLGSLRRFIILEWPALRAAAASAAVTVFLLCFGSFAVVLVLGGSPRYNTLEVALYEALRLEFDIPRAVLIAAVQLGAALALLLPASLIAAAPDIGAPHRGVGYIGTPFVRTLRRAWLTAATLFFALPLLYVAVSGLRAPFTTLMGSKSFWSALTLSLQTATLASLFAVLLAYALAAAKRRWLLAVPPKRLTAQVVTVAGNLYLAVPSMVLALGFFLLSLQSALPPEAWAFVALVAANTLVALPFALGLLYPKLYAAARRYDKLARALGLKGRRRFRTVEWPLVRRSVGYVAALAFCFSLGDVGVIALFGSEGFTTLPWYLYSLMGSYRMDEAAGVALVLTVLSVAVFWLLPRLIGGKEDA